MNPVRELVLNATLAKELSPRYYWLSTVVGLAGVVAGAAVLWVFAGGLSVLLSVSLEVPLLEQQHGRTWALLFFLGIPVFFYLGCAVIGGMVAVVLFMRGLMSGTEAIAYALLSRYPKAWFRSQLGA